jgi:hypothetical protein
MKKSKNVETENWIVVPKTNNRVLAWIANLSGTIGGWLLDFYLRYGDRHEIDLDFIYGGDSIPVDPEFETWLRKTTDEIFNDIDKRDNNEKNK